MVQPLLLSAENFGGAPKALTDITTELVREHRKDAGTKAVAGMLDRGVRGIIAVTDFFARNVGFNLPAPNGEPWPENFEIYSIDFPDGARSHSAQA